MLCLKVAFWKGGVNFTQVILIIQIEYSGNHNKHVHNPTLNTRNIPNIITLL